MQKTSVQRLQEETLGAQDCRISGSWDGREPTWNWKKTRFAGREFATNSGSCWRLTLDVDVCGASLETATASPILNFCFTLDKVGVLEYSRSVTQKIDL